jgi:hypothetical protein
MSEPRPDDDLTASGTPAPAGDTTDSAGTPESASEIVAADMATIDATPPGDATAAPPVTPAPGVAPPPMAAYTPPPEVPPMTAYTPPPPPPPTDWAATTPTPAPPATDWSTPASPTPPAGTPVQSVPETQAWQQAPAPAYQPPPTYPPQPQAQPGWPQQPPAYQQPQAYAPPPAYPPQQPYQQPAAYPPQQTWQQPGQPAGWVQPQGEYWGQQGVGVWAYKTSVLALLASLWLLIVGLISAGAGGIALAIGSTRVRPYLVDNGVAPDAVNAVVQVIGIVGGFFLVCGILILLSVLGIWFHKTWGRVIAIIFSVLGLLLSLPFLAAGSYTSTLTDGRTVVTNAAPLGVGFVVLWGLTLLFLIISGGHFHKHRVG